MAEITLQDLHELLENFGKNSYLSGAAAAGSLDYRIMAKVEALYRLDYSLVTLENSKSSLCIRYPEKIFIPEAEHGHQMINTHTLNQTTAMETLTEAAATTTLTSSTAHSSCSTSATTIAHGANGIKTMQGCATISNNFNTNKTEKVAADDVCGGSNDNGLGGNNVQQFVTFADQVDSSKELTPTTTPLATPFGTQINAFPSYQQQQQQSSQHTIYEALFDIGKVRELISNARYARCRNRFVVPVMLFRGKFICRSATISLPSEQYSRKMLDTACYYVARLGGSTDTTPTNGNGNGCGNANSNGAQNGSTQNVNQQQQQQQQPNSLNDPAHDTEVDDPVADKHLAALQQNSTTPPPSFSNEEVIKSDIQLLRALNVNTIVDLMVENQKKKFLVTVSSSEKADEQQRYRDFAILGIPYPGCEFFRKFRDNNYVSQNLYYEWNQTFIDARIKIPHGSPAAELDINWSDYEKWDLMQMTQNYLKAMLKHIQDDSAGLLVHCISGWDRTPLFISLIRLSLWADGLIHQSLGAMEMAYLTLAYDWYLFGHQLPNRLSVGEDILIFCFHILKYVWSDDFRVVVGGGSSSSMQRRRTKTSSSSSSSVIILRPDGEEDQRDDFLLDMDSNESSNCDTPFGESFYVYPSAMAAATPAVQQQYQTQTSASSSSSSPALMTNANSFAGILTQANAAGAQTGRSPNLKRTRTSPIAVPGSSSSSAAATATTSRQRHDSSSLSSWMIVSGAGSIDSMKSGVTMSERLEATTAAAAAATAATTDNLTQNNTIFGSTNSNGSNISVEVDGICSGMIGIGGGANDSLRPPLTQRRQRLEDLRNIVIPAYARMVGLRFNEGTSGIINTITEQLW